MKPIKGVLEEKMKFFKTAISLGRVGNQTIHKMKSIENSNVSSLKEITSSDEARYVEQEERAAKRIADDDPNYKNISSSL